MCNFVNHIINSRAQRIPTTLIYTSSDPTVTAEAVDERDEVDGGMDEVDAALELTVEGAAVDVAEAPRVDVENRRRSGMRMAP